MAATVKCVCYTDDMDEIAGLPSSRASIGRWSVDRYIDLIRWPTLAGMAIFFVMRYFEQSASLILGLEALVCVAIGFLVVRRGGHAIEGLTAGILAGLGLGFATALAQVVLTPQPIWFVNLISEPMLTGLAGGLLAVSAMIVRRLIVR